MNAVASAGSGPSLGFRPSPISFVTRQLIEYGGLVVKAGLAERTEDDRATMLGAFLMLRDLLDGHGDDAPADLQARWRRRDQRGQFGLSVICVQKVPLTKVSKINEMAPGAGAISLI